MSCGWATDRLLEGFGSKSACGLSTARFEAKNSKSRAKQFGSNRPKMGSFWQQMGPNGPQLHPNCARARSYEVLLEQNEAKSELCLAVARF